MYEPGKRVRSVFAPLVDKSAAAIITIIVDILVVLMLVVLVWAVVTLGIAIFHTIAQRNVGNIKDLVVGVLTIFIVIEIFDLFREYARSAHVKVTNLAEVSLAVVLRELWLLLLGGSTDWKLYLALGAVIVALAFFWYLAARVQGSTWPAADGGPAAADVAAKTPQEEAAPPTG